MKRIRVVSNGYGEDSIATNVVRHLDLDAYHVDVYPLVGRGDAYRSLNLTPCFDQHMMPSGGFLHSLSDIRRDVSAGLLQRTVYQYRRLSKANHDVQLVVGDVFALWMATRNRGVPTVFLPTAKSERAIPHSWLEHWLIRRYATSVFPRDIETNRIFESKGISSMFVGNPMFDNMVSSIAQPDVFTIGILPGSRHEAVANMKTLLAIVDQLVVARPVRFVVSLSPHVTGDWLRGMVSNIPWRLYQKDNQWVIKNNHCSVDVSYAFFDVLQQSSMVIGLAGTANEQAMFAKRPLVSFIGSGSQSTFRRFKQQHGLIEGAITEFIPSSDPCVIAQAVSAFIDSHSFKWAPLSDVFQRAGLCIARHIEEQVDESI